MLSLQDGGLNSPVMQFGLWPFPDVQSRVGHLNLHFLIWKMKIAIPTLQVWFEAG